MKTRTIGSTVYEEVTPTLASNKQAAAIKHNAEQAKLPELMQQFVNVPASITLRRLTPKMSKKTSQRMLKKNPNKLRKELNRIAALQTP